jgi:hypothetical protein
LAKIRKHFPKHTVQVAYEASYIGFTLQRDLLRSRQRLMHQRERVRRHLQGPCAAMACITGRKPGIRATGRSSTTAGCARSTLDIGSFLCHYDELLLNFDFSQWHFFDDRVLKGPNWKIAYDGYLDFYHLTVLHRNTFGADTYSQALYYQWGPHQRVSCPGTVADIVGDRSEQDWPRDALLAGVWTVFPHVSIACFAGVSAVEESSYQCVMLSQLFHAWVDRILETEDEELPELFAPS